MPIYIMYKGYNEKSIGFSQKMTAKGHTFSQVLISVYKNYEIKGNSYSAERVCQKYEVSLAFDFQYLNVLRITNELMSLLISITKIINQYKFLYKLMDISFFFFIKAVEMIHKNKQTNKKHRADKKKINPRNFRSYRTLLKIVL